jgi:hypothetical protein
MVYKCVICCAFRTVEQAALKNAKHTLIVCSQCIDRTGTVAIRSFVDKPGVLVKNLRVLSPLDLYLHGYIEVSGKVYNVVISPSSFEVLTTRAHNKLEGRGGSATQRSLWLRTYTGGRVRFMDQATNELKNRRSGISMTEAINLLVRFRPFRRRFARFHTDASFQGHSGCARPHLAHSTHTAQLCRSLQLVQSRDTCEAWRSDAMLSFQGPVHCSCTAQHPCSSFAERAAWHPAPLR